MARLSPKNARPQEAIEASAGHRADGFDVAKVLGDENDCNRCDQEHGISVEARTGEFRQTYPRRGGQRRKVDRLFQSEAVGEQQIQQIPADSPENDRQSAPDSRCCDGDQPDDQNRKQPDPGIELATAHGFNGDGREIETNSCNDRASHNRRHQSFDPVNAQSHDNQSDDAVQHTRCNDATQRNIEVRVRPMAGISGCSNDDGNEREAGAQVARYPSCYNYKEDQSAEPRKEHCPVRIKTHDERRDNRSARHRDPALQTRADRLAPRQAFLGHDHARCLQLPMWKIALSHFRPRGRRNVPPFIRATRPTS